VFSGLETQAAVAMLVTACALYLFSRDRIPLEHSCIVILLAMVLMVEIWPYQYAGRTVGAGEFLAGFGNEALITICLLLMVAKGIEVSGALQPLGRGLARLWRMNRSLAFLATLVAAATVSAFMNNTPVVVMLLPLLVGVAASSRIPPSRILMPAGFATIIGGMSTTIGTSTNLLVVNVSASLGVPRIGMFDFIVPAAIAGAIAILYLWAIAPRLLPDRTPPLTKTSPRIFEAVVEVAEESPMAGKTLAELRALIRSRVRLERVMRGSGLELMRLPSLTVRAGDRLLIRGTAAAIREVQELFGAGVDITQLRRLRDQVLIEVVVTQASALCNHRLSQASESLIGRLVPIAIFRPGASVAEDLDQATDPVLRSGDVLLMQGNREEVRRLKDQHQLLILDRTIHLPRTSKAPLTLAILVAVIALAAFGLLPIIASALLGVTVMLLTRCLALDEAWSALDLRLILVIVTSLALGTALMTTGAAAFIAQTFVALTEGLPPPVVLSALLLATALLTEVVTNNAVAVIGTPIAVAVAQQLGVPEIGFVLAVLFGANMSYLTPIGYQTNVLVFSTGGYRFSDFFRVGIPLQLILWLALSLLLPMMYL
jgi:di/tricarboxylate transporter